MRALLQQIGGELHIYEISFYVQSAGQAIFLNHRTIEAGEVIMEDRSAVEAPSTTDRYKSTLCICLSLCNILQSFYVSMDLQTYRLLQIFSHKCYFIKIIMEILTVRKRCRTQLYVSVKFVWRVCVVCLHPTTFSCSRCNIPLCCEGSTLHQVHMVKKIQLGKNSKMGNHLFY